MIHTKRMLVAFILPGLAAIFLIGLFRIDHSYPGHGRRIFKIGFMAVIGLVQFLNGGHPAAVINIGAKLYKTGAHAVGNAFGYPDTDLGIALNRILPAIFFFDPYAEDVDDRFHTQSGPELFGAHGIGPGWDHSSACLLIGEKEIGVLARLELVRKSIGDKTRLKPMFPYPRIPEEPQLS